MRFNDLFQIVGHIHKNCPKAKIQLTTTGWPYFEYISKELSSLSLLQTAGLTDIYLSLTTLDKEIYGKVVRPGIPNYNSRAFEESIQFATSARDLGIRVTLGFINLPGTKEADVKKFAETMKINYKIRELEK